MIFVARGGSRKFSMSACGATLSSTWRKTTLKDAEIATKKQQQCM